MVSATHTGDVASLAEVNLFEVEPREDVGMDEDYIVNLPLAFHSGDDLGFANVPRQ